MQQMIKNLVLRVPDLPTMRALSALCLNDPCWIGTELRRGVLRLTLLWVLTGVCTLAGALYVHGLYTLACT